MMCTTGRLNLAINVMGALLLVTILNAYIIHTKFQGEAEKDIVEHFTKHIHVNKQLPSRPTPDPKLLSSNDPKSNPLRPSSNTLGGGGAPNSMNNNNNNNNNKDFNVNNANVERLRKEWASNPTRTDKGSKYPRDTCIPRHTTQQSLLDLPLTVITATSEGYVGHVHNLIGSIHTHQPEVDIAVYNLGFSDETTKDLENYCGVTVHKFNFDAYPSHVQALKNFAWKALVVKQALLDYGKILYIDSGYEVRRPLDFIKGRIEREGYFCTGMGDSLTRGGREGMFNFFNTSTLEYLGLPMSAGGVHGGTFWGGAFEGIVLPAAACSVDASCITPERTGDEVRSFGKDQPLFSNLVYRGGCTQCAMSSAFTAHSSMAAMAGDPFVAGKQHLFHRRGSGPFNGQGLRRTQCADRQQRNQQIWKGMREQFNTTYLGNGGCPHTRFSTKKPIDKLYVLGDVPKSVDRVVAAVRKTEVTLVSSASSKEFTHLLALLESIKEWEPSHPVVVYDLGLEDSQKAEIQKMKSPSIKIEKLDIDPYPHIKDLASMAWRPYLWATAYQAYGSIIYLSPSHVLYQRLDTLIFMLEKDGIFGVTVGLDVLDLYKDKSSAVEFFKSWPAVSKDRRANGEKLMNEFAFKPPCTARVVGFWKGSSAAGLVLPPLFDCATDATCWATAKSSLGDASKTDQMLLSVMIYDKVCYTCNRDYDFFAYAGKVQSIIHSSPSSSSSSFSLFSTALIDQVQVVFDNVQD